MDFGKAARRLKPFCNRIRYLHAYKGARMKMNDDPQQIIKAYFDGLAAKDVSRVPWADNATLRTPLNPAGGESELIRGRKAILDFFAGILPALRSVRMVRHYASEAGWVAGQAEIALSNGKTLYVLDAFYVQKGEIIEQQNHYDPRAAAG